ncbi:MAG: hypothetical protein MI810_07730 [Flavobacteriales bacterium]|nr:hypothetical protein [Flavobacteriales bacterium]
MKNSAIFVLLSALFLLSCRKEKTSWDSDWSAPLVHGELTINDLIPADYTETNSDDYLSIVFHESAYSFSIDTLIDLPDTSVIKVINIGEFSDISIAPGFSFNDNYEGAYDLGGVELKRVIIKSGTAEMQVKSPWKGKSLLTIQFPLINEDGVPFERTYPVPAGSVENPSIVIDEVSMADFDMNLKGLTGMSYNEVPADFIVTSDETESSFVVTSADSVTLKVTFKDMIPKYAKGYFGQYTLSDTLGFGLAPMKKVIDGSIDIDSVDLKVTIMNGFNLIAQSRISKIAGINSRTGTEVSLSFPELGSSININPATGGIHDMVPSSYPIDINNTNSNIAEFIENLSDSIVLGYELKINPEGNVSAGTDEFFPTSKMDLFVDAEFPLKFSANDLTLVDTFDISYNPIETVTPNNGAIVMAYENGFPLGAEAYFYLMDDNNVVLDSIKASSPIISGSYDELMYLTTPSAGQLTYSVPQSTIDNLELAKKMMLVVSFSTDSAEKVRINAESFFNFSIRTNLQINVQL